jgi:CDP-6-deoxy-D-xylo-4-hexulose-3-dehydrase
MEKFSHSLMDNNVTKEDVNCLIKFLQQDPIPILTNASPKIKEFEDKWSKWLDVKYSLFVNSGSAANQITMLGLKRMFPDGGEILVPVQTWVSDISAVLQNGFTPVFVDCNLENIGMDLSHLTKKITKKTVALFLTHSLGFNCLSDKILELCKTNNILLIEDCCEGYPVTFKGQKTGTFGFASNFSFFMAHHGTTIEGGMVSTNDWEFYQYLRSYRSHGMVREMTDNDLKTKLIAENPKVNKDFIFLAPAYNFRSTALNAVIGLNQLKNLDKNGKKRAQNFEYFLSKLSKEKYITNFDLEGQNNYGFIVILKNGTIEKRNLLEKTLSENGIEFRRGLNGGGCQAFQPYIKPYLEKNLIQFNENEFPNSSYVTQFSWYLGNYPRLNKAKINKITKILNDIVL